MKVNLRKTTVMVSGINEETPDSIIDPCGVCGKGFISNSVLQYVQHVVSECMHHA